VSSAANEPTSRPIDLPADEILVRAAEAPDRGPWTKAGRALQKKTSRSISAFPSIIGPAENYNAAGSSTVREILFDPRRSNRVRHHALYGWIIEVRDHIGRGVRYDAAGDFLGFLEP